MQPGQPEHVLCMQEYSQLSNVPSFSSSRFSRGHMYNGTFDWMKVGLCVPTNAVGTGKAEATAEGTRRGDSDRRLTRSIAQNPHHVEFLFRAWEADRHFQLDLNLDRCHSIWYRSVTGLLSLISAGCHTSSNCLRLCFCGGNCFVLWTCFLLEIDHNGKS